MEGGRSFNFHICKKCNTRHKNEENWSMLCLPIPEVSHSKKIQVEYIPFDLTKYLCLLTVDPRSPWSTLTISAVGC
jgi:hypothetical protein